MEPDALLDLHDRLLREHARPDGPGARVERTGDVVRQVAGDADGWNGVVWSALDETGADAAIAEQVAHFTALGREFEWKLYGHDRPADLGRRLTAAGFTAEPAETVFVGEAATLTDCGELPEGVSLLTVTEAEQVELAVAVHEKAFGTDGTRLGNALRARLVAEPDSLVLVVAMAGETPVSSARMELVPGTGFAGLWGGGTVADWRGRGLYRALIAHRARIAVARGYRHLQVDASDDSRPILQRLGFVPLTTTTPYIHPGTH
ncbi:GNAT family N-acetyltransferase [Streptomyces mangrovisoli]|uniref:GNAT family N-acetyltransferase n=1 Tax=Streptomyces mangrovisoli TaxID=1428628 RepID=A0A1J4NQI3_9ACTN|nr:GNAT family N-acetyltransferase [Streptomyces mangrovisoli]OIJ63501.1 GNAT family N-acetyltransferase [Streptomyces mangrovisoli]